MSSNIIRKFLYAGYYFKRMSCHFLLFIYIDEPSRKKKGTYEAGRAAAGAWQPYRGPFAAPGRPAGCLAGLGKVCHKKLIDDMPKVSLSSHMNGLRSPSLPPPTGFYS